MGQKILIIYGSRYGGTEILSNDIANAIEERGIAADVVDAKNARADTFKEYDGVLIGSGIKIQRWTKDAENALKTIRDMELDEKIPIGMFVSCWAVLDNIDKAYKDYLEDFISKYGLKVVIYKAFGPVLDFSKSSKMSFLSKRMMKGILMKWAKKGELGISENGRNILYDSEEVIKFADGFLDLLKGNMK